AGLRPDRHADVLPDLDGDGSVREGPAETADRALGEPRALEPAGIKGRCPGQSAAAVALDLEGGAELLLEVERLVPHGRADHDLQPAPPRHLERGNKRPGVAVDVEMGVDPLEVQFFRSTGCPEQRLGGNHAKHVAPGQHPDTSLFPSSTAGRQGAFDDRDVSGARSARTRSRPTRSIHDVRHSAQSFSKSRIASSFRPARARALASLNRSSPVVRTVAMMRMASSEVTFEGTPARTGGPGSVRIP